MTESSNADLVDGLLGIVHRLTEAVLKAAPEDREAKYAAARDVGYQAGLQSGLDEAAARDAGERMEEWTRGLAKMILAGGGAAGGTA